MQMYSSCYPCVQWLGLHQIQMQTTVFAWELKYVSYFTKLPEIHQFSIIQFIIILIPQFIIILIPQFIIILIPCLLVLFPLMNMPARVGTYWDARLPRNLDPWTQHGWLKLPCDNPAFYGVASETTGFPVRTERLRTRHSAQKKNDLCTEELSHWTRSVYHLESNRFCCL